MGHVCCVELSVLDCRVSPEYDLLKDILFEELILGMIRFDYWCHSSYFYNADYFDGRASIRYRSVLFIALEALFFSWLTTLLLMTGRRTCSTTSEFRGLRPISNRVIFYSKRSEAKYWTLQVVQFQFFFFAEIFISVKSFTCSNDFLELVSPGVCGNKLLGKMPRFINIFAMFPVSERWSWQILIYDKKLYE